VAAPLRRLPARGLQNLTRLSEHSGTTLGERLRRLLRDAGHLFGGTTFSGLLGLASFLLIARSLGPDAFGALVLVTSFGTAVTRLCGFQSWQAIIRFASDAQAKRTDAEVAAIFRLGLLVDVGAATFAAALTWLGAGAAARLFDWSATVEASVPLYAIAVLFTITGAPTAALRLYRRFDLIALQQAVSAALRLAIVTTVYVAAPSFNSFLTAWIVAHVAQHLLLAAFAARVLRAQRLFDADVRRGARLRDVSSRAVWRYLAITNADGVVRVLRELDSQIVALFADEAAAGILRVGRQIAVFAGRLVDAFFEAIYPQLAQLAALRQWHEFGALVRHASRRVGLLTTLPLVGFVLVGAPLVDLVFGAGYADAYPVTCILLLGVVVWGFTQAYAPALMSLGAVGRSLLIHAATSIVYFFALIALVQEFAAHGAAWATVLFNVLWGVLTIAVFRASVPAGRRSRPTS
jgi:O-antigen/teichoic acid export membrane protein